MNFEQRQQWIDENLSGEPKLRAEARLHNEMFRAKVDAQLARPEVQRRIVREQKRAHVGRWVGGALFGALIFLGAGHAAVSGDTTHTPAPAMCQATHGQAGC